MFENIQLAELQFTERIGLENSGKSTTLMAVREIDITGLYYYQFAQLPPNRKGIFVDILACREKVARLHFKRSMYQPIVTELGLTMEQTIYLVEYGHIGQIDQILSLHLARQ